jgi:ubiquinone/menaquinone biosynthesis C-methylase UbiE
MTEKKNHWEAIYKTKSSKEVSWYSPRLEKSLELIQSLNLPNDAHIIDVGGGASTLPDDLIVAGFKNIAVLDISKEALKASQERLGKKSGLILWIEGDATELSLEPELYDCWHDRAVFHFLTNPEDRQKYIKNLKKTLRPRGYALIATFGPNGPLKCSGLEIIRYSAESLQRELGNSFQLERHFVEIHKTPFDTAQEFLYCLFRKQ